MAGHLADDMAKHHLKGKTITLKIKLATFEVRTRAITLPCYVSSPEEILNPMLKLLVMELPMKIRLMGVRVSNFWEEKKNPDQASILNFVTREEPSKFRGLTNIRVAHDNTECARTKICFCFVEDLSADGASPVEQEKRYLTSSNANSGRVSHTPNQTPGPSDSRVECSLPSGHEHMVPCSSGGPATSLDHDMDVLCPEGVSQSKCGVCGMDVGELKPQEHEDLHLAIEIEKEDRRISNLLERTPRASHGKRPKKRPSGLGSLDAYLIKRR